MCGRCVLFVAMNYPVSCFFTLGVFEHVPFETKHLSTQFHEKLIHQKIMGFPGGSRPPSVRGGGGLDPPCKKKQKNEADGPIYKINMRNYFRDF